MNAVITGASRGIGKAVAEIFSLHGYNLWLCSKNEHSLLKTIQELKVLSPKVQINGQAYDVGKKEQARLFAGWVLNQAGTIDALINNVGTYVPGNISDEPDGALENMMEVNLLSAYHTTRAFLPSMKTARSGHIFTMCSIASLHAYPNGGAYSISKFALLGFTRNLREELKEYGIKVTAILPGAVYTDSWTGSGVSKQRIMEVQDIAKTIYNATVLSPQAVIDEILIRPQLGDL